MDGIRFTGVDPLAEKYYSWSPYVYCVNNSFKYIDPTGMAPIFDKDGNLIGTDADGWEGTAIVMDKDNYKKGMSNEDALKVGTKLDEYGEGIKISDESWTTVTDNGGQEMRPFVRNNSKNTAYFKPENTIGEYKDGGAYPVAAGKDIYMPVDGVKTIDMKADEVYKVLTGGDAIIHKDGSIGTTDLFNTIGLLIPDGFRYSSGYVKTPASNFKNLANSFKVNRQHLPVGTNGSIRSIPK